MLEVCVQARSSSCEAGPAGTERQLWAVTGVPPELWLQGPSFHFGSNTSLKPFAGQLNKPLDTGEL